MTDIVGNETLRDMWGRLAHTDGDRAFLIFQDRAGKTCEYTYRSFDEEINRTANLFLGLGVEKGARVVVQMHTCPEFMMCLFGLAKIGAVMVPLNEQYIAEETRLALERTEATCAVVEPELADCYEKLCFEHGYLPQGVFVARMAAKESGEAGKSRFARPGDRRPFGGRLRCFETARMAESADLAQIRPLSADDPAEIIFTSGTTSRPKGVVLTHANMLFSGHYGNWELSLTSEDRMFTTMPACHSNFQMAALMPVLTAGAVLIVVEKYSASRFWKQVRTYRATVAQCVAMMLRTLMLQPVDALEREHCLREMLYFLPVSEEEKLAFEERFDVSIMNTYGSTETICWVLTDLPLGPRRWPSVGRVGLGYEVRIVCDNGEEAAVGEIGEIQVRGIRGRSIMKEYYNDPEETARTFTEDGWLRTGDKGYADADGWFFFVDRKVNMIKRSGENISASEVENVLLAHSSIEEAAVIGVADPIRDQAVKAFVKLRAGSTMDAADVIAYCKEHMAGFKVPSIVEIVDDFPRTCSMKIQKKLLR